MLHPHRIIFGFSYVLFIPSAIIPMVSPIFMDGSPDYPTSVDIPSFSGFYPWTISLKVKKAGVIIAGL
ncbi:hypothetical protein G4Z05_00940 [Bacillus thermocopriae]|uniref:Uncharacterized protein n=2 Tax=Neobacillus thermocopriae TaxID=1215031 RepID=A0A6B3TNV9_9BACI|nr:hypothetical protein [Neobacillus thermocopriae]